VTRSGRQFQIAEAATGNALSATAVLRLENFHVRWKQRKKLHSVTAN